MLTRTRDGVAFAKFPGPTSAHRLGVLVITAALVGPANAVDAQQPEGPERIHNEVPRWEAGEEWKIPADPIFQIGTVFGEAEYQFARIADAGFLSDGRVVVADQMRKTIRVFSPEGEFLGSMGGDGEGPGEFRRVGDIVVLPGDSIAAWDARLRRLTVFDSQGKSVRTAPVDWRGRPSLYGAEMVSQGLLALQTAWSSGSLPGAERVAGLLIRDSMEVLLVRTDGEIEGSLGSFPGLEIGVTKPEGRARMARPPFGRSLSMCASNGTVVVGTQESLEYRVYSEDGRLIRNVQAPTPDLAIDDDLKDAYWEVVTEFVNPTTPKDRQALRHRREYTPFPPTRAAFGDLICDSAGYVWMRENRSLPGRMLPPSWLVFDPDGAWLGRVIAPDGFTILAVEGDRLIGRWRDDMNVEFLRVYELVK